MEPTASLVVRHAKQRQLLGNTKDGSKDSGKHGKDSRHHPHDLPIIVREDVRSTPFQEVEIGQSLSKPEVVGINPAEIPEAIKSQMSEGAPEARGLDLAEHIGKVDFVSTTHNIKEIFKLPYTNDDVSLAIYRIGKTLVVNTAPIPTVNGEVPEAPAAPAWLKPAKTDAPLALGYDGGDVKAEEGFETTSPAPVPPSEDLLQQFLQQNRQVAPPSSTKIPMPEVTPAAVTPISPAAPPRRLRANSLPTSLDPAENQPRFTRVSCWKFNHMKMVRG